MILFDHVDRTCLKQYDLIPMRVWVTSILKLRKIDRGFGGIVLEETPVEPYIKDFNVGKDESVARWAAQFDLSNWAFFMAFDGEKPVGAATIASRTKGVNMLAGRDDLAVLWDIRVADGYKRQGVGQRLFDMAVDWARAKGHTQLKIECQNNNVPAVRFYHKQGAVLSAIDEYAYDDEPAFKHETQFIWYLDL